MTDDKRAAISGVPEEMRGVIERAGPWQSHNYHLGDGVWTIAPEPITNDYRLRRIFQVAGDLTRGDLATLRVLDLACEEGMFGLEFARRGAEVVAVEAREPHVERASFAAEALGLGNYEVHCADVRDVTRARYGEFDVVLCLGIVYHLDAPDVFEFALNLGELCRWALFVESNISTTPAEAREFGGRRYSGRRYLEHRPRSSADERKSLLRASIDNTESFWLTRSSLINLLTDAGFTSVVEGLSPRYSRLRADQVFLVALKGGPTDLLSVPGMEEVPRPRYEEREKVGLGAASTRLGRLAQGLRRHGLADLKHALRRFG
jgi:SAM-dependent methyltransferase